MAPSPMFASGVLTLVGLMGRLAVCLRDNLKKKLRRRKRLDIWASLPAIGSSIERTAPQWSAQQISQLLPKPKEKLLLS